MACDPRETRCSVCDKSGKCVIFKNWLTKDISSYNLFVINHAEKFAGKYLVKGELLIMGKASTSGKKQYIVLFKDNTYKIVSDISDSNIKDFVGASIYSLDTEYKVVLKLEKVDTKTKK